MKIGFEICLKLLRAGATVLVTTRFPKVIIFPFFLFLYYIVQSGVQHSSGVSDVIVEGLVTS